MALGLKDMVEEFVGEMLRNHKPSKVRDNKVIQDSILGSNLYYPHEIAVLDLPLMQRLRRVSQTDFTPCVWPSSNHNRLEHSLGAVVMADRIISSVQHKQRQQGSLGEEEANRDRLTVRMSALLHDCGHGPFSHASELYYKRYPEVLECKKTDRFAGASPHEILSYMIVTSGTFRSVFSGICNMHDCEIDLDRVANMIIGYTGDEPEKAYLVDVINGPFDADKLDYIARDSHFTGIKLTIDLDRLIYTICALEHHDKQGKKKTRLCVDPRGLTSIEQVWFNKMVLKSTVYPHHKVLAAGSVLRSLIHELRCGDKHRFESVADFLRYTDHELIGLGLREGNKTAKKLAEMLTLRNLPRRALVISMESADSEALEKLPKLVDEHCQESTGDQDPVLDMLPNLISERTGNQVAVSNIWVAITEPPMQQEDATGLLIRRDDKAVRLTPKSENGEETGMSVSQWHKAFARAKHRSYVLAMPGDRSKVHHASVQMFKELDIRIDSRRAWELSNMGEYEIASLGI